MRIVSITGYAIRFPFLAGSFATSYGRRTALANILLVIAAEDGTEGFGEICQASVVTPTPLDPDEVDRTMRDCRTLIGMESRDIAEAVRGLGPRALANLRCAVDTALWDMMGRRTGQPLYRLFGGRAGQQTAVYATLSSEAPDGCHARRRSRAPKGDQPLPAQNRRPSRPRHRSHRSAGRFASTRGKALADANGGLDLKGAIAVADVTRETRMMFEEPCATFEENLEIARASACQIVLDQCMNSPAMYVRAIAEQAFAGVGVKPTNLGGLSTASTVRNLCIAAGLPMKIDDMWAADNGSLGVLHLAAGVPQDLLLASVDMRP